MALRSDFRGIETKKERRSKAPLRSTSMLRFLSEFCQLISIVIDQGGILSLDIHSSNQTGCNTAW